MHIIAFSHSIYVWENICQYEALNPNCFRHEEAAAELRDAPDLWAKGQWGTLRPGKKTNQTNRHRKKWERKTKKIATSLSEIEAIPEKKSIDFQDYNYGWLTKE